MQKLKQQVFEANMDLPHYGLVTFTRGNVSAIDRERGLVVIAQRCRLRNHESGRYGSGRYERQRGGRGIVRLPDTATHLELYRRYPSLGGIVHTTPLMPPHGRRRAGDPGVSTTHADYFGDIPCTRGLSEEEVQGEYG